MSGWEATSAMEWRDDRLNMMIYGPLGSGKTYFAAQAPKPLYVAIEPGAMTCKYVVTKMGLPDYPVINTIDHNVVLDILIDPVAWVTNHLSDKWPGYVPESVVVDTLTTLEGFIMDSLLDKAGKAVAENPEFRRLHTAMMTIFRRAWDLRQHTLLLGHDQSGRLPQRNRDGTVTQGKDKGPNLTGQLLKAGPGIADFYLYFKQRTIPGCGTEYVAHTVETPDGFPAKARGNWPAEIVNPTFEYFLGRLRSGEALQGGSAS